MNPLASLGLVMPALPPEAFIALLIGAAISFAMMFAGAALADWKARNPTVARAVGAVLALGFTTAVAILLWKFVPQLRQDYVEVVPSSDPAKPLEITRELVSLFDGPMLAFLGLLAALMWRYVDLPRVGVGLAAGVATALVLKPFVWPLSTVWEKGEMHQRGVLDFEHLTFLGPGLALAIVALVLASMPRRQPSVGFPTAQRSGV